MKIKASVIAVIGIVFFAPSVFSAENEPKPAQAVSEAKAASQKKEAVKPKQEFTKEYFIEHIKGTLSHMEEIMNFVQGLKKETDKAGNVTYTYNGTKLGDLDKEQLSKLYGRINNEAVRIRTERLNRQLESIRQAERASRVARQTARQIVVPAPPPRPPIIYTPPQPPPMPSAVTQPPKIPPPPPTPERR